MLLEVDVLRPGWIKIHVFGHQFRPGGSSSRWWGRACCGFSRGAATITRPRLPKTAALVVAAWGHFFRQHGATACGGFELIPPPIPTASRHPITTNTGPLHAREQAISDAGTATEV